MLKDHERPILAAQGYAELGMFDDALAEVDALPSEVQAHPTAVELRIAILMQAKRWQEALPICERLCHLDPERNSGYMQAAFCLHALGRTAEARDRLLTGPQSLHAEATFHYNLACYECTLGQIELARLHLEKSISLDKKFRDFARTDPDLRALRE